ncbi:MAG TPA: PQQ-dependent sugar dehydrogenase [Bacteroidota bacterium]
MKHFNVVCMLVIALAQANAQYALQDAYPSLPAFSFPVELVHAYDGTNRLFVVEQRGSIWVFENNGSVSTRKEFLNLSDRVSQNGYELGLLGLAFHPDYESNGYFFVNYTTGISGPWQTVVSRFYVNPADPDSALKESEFVLMTFSQPYSNHNGGKLAFGPDGYLYIGSGDGGSANDPQNRAQNRSNLLGKILRIDVNNTSGALNYAIPPTNPFAGNTEGFREEIYAYGLRNPWKFSFDSMTGTLWLGDVGQGAREEIDTVVNGGNYGWSLMEGFLCTPEVNPGCLDTAGLLRPVWDYTRSSGESITGGYVYRGSATPSLYGKYVYGDFISGRIWALTYDGVSPTSNQLLVQHSSNSISSFAEDQQQELLVVSHANGRIYRLTGPPVTGVQESGATPKTFSLHQNYPNPFNPKTTLGFQIAESGMVRLRIFDLLGNVMATLVNEELQPGNYRSSWNATGFPSGVYFYRLEAGAFVETKTMLMLQ